MSAIRRSEWEWGQAAAGCRRLPITALLRVIEPQAPPPPDENAQPATVVPLAPSGFVYII